MRIDRIKFLPLLATLSILFAVSCTKDDTDSGYPGLQGKLVFDAPDFVVPGQVIDIDIAIDDLSKLNGSHQIGFYWSDNVQNKKDTLRNETDPLSVSPAFKYVIPDDKTHITLTICAYCENYSAYSTVCNFTVVRDELNNGLITDFDIRQTDSLLTDTRDGKKYLTTKIGSNRWMRQNLAYEEYGVPYVNEPLLSNIFGQYYSWEEATSGNICPEGWELPSESDWVDLAKASGCEQAALFEPFYEIAGSNMVNARYDEELMWEFWPQVKITDKTGFAAIPAGYCEKTEDGCIFRYYGKYAAFWTADGYQVETSGGDDGIFRYFHVESPDIMASHASRNGLGMSVRCIKKK